MEYQVIEKAMYLTKFNPFRQLSSGLHNDYNALHILQVATALQVGDRPVVGL